MEIASLCSLNPCQEISFCKQILDSLFGYTDFHGTMLWYHCVYYFILGDYPEAGSWSGRGPLQYAQESQPALTTCSTKSCHEQLFWIQLLHRPVGSQCTRHSQWAVGRRLVPSLPSIHILTLWIFIRIETGPVAWVYVHLSVLVLYMDCTIDWTEEHLFPTVNRPINVFQQRLNSDVILNSSQVPGSMDALLWSCDPQEVAVDTLFA